MLVWNYIAVLYFIPTSILEWHFVIVIRSIWVGAICSCCLHGFSWVRLICVSLGVGALFCVFFSLQGICFPRIMGGGSACVFSLLCLWCCKCVMRFFDRFLIGFSVVFLEGLGKLVCLCCYGLWFVVFLFWS